MIVDIKASANKSLKKLEKKNAKLSTTIEALYLIESISEIPNDGKLKGYSDHYKIRIGNYRIIYKTESENHILITAIAHRKDVYNKLFGLTFSL